MPKRGEHECDQRHEEQGEGQGGEIAGAEAGGVADQYDDQALRECDGGAAAGAADHDRDARHGRDQGFFQEAELAVPDQFDAGEDGREQDGHADHAGG